MSIDKEHVRKVVDEALTKVLKAQDKINNSNDIIDSTDLEEELEQEEISNSEENSNVLPDEENIDVDVQDKVTEAIEEEVAEEADYTFLGLDISIVKNDEGKFEVTIKKDDFEKTEELESIDVKNILNFVEAFFSDLVIEEEFETDEDKEDKEETEEVSKDIEEDLEEENLDKTITEDEEFEDSESSGLISDIKVLKEKYKDNVDSIFEQGLLAKELVIDILKDKLVAGTVKDLINRVNEKDTLIASKREELRKASINYILAQRLNTKYKKAHALLSSQMTKIKEELDKNENALSVETLAKLNKFYSSVVAKILNSNKAEDVETVTNMFEKTTNTLLASIVKVKPTVNKVNKKEINKEDKSVMASNKPKPTNILNKGSWRGNKTIMSHRYEGIDEMSAEILHIAGID